MNISGTLQDAFQTSKNAASNLGKTSYQAVQSGYHRSKGLIQQAIYSTPTASSDKFISVRLMQPALWPLILSGLGLLYQQGQEKAKGQGNGDPNSWLRILTESSLAYLLMSKTAGLYTLAGLGIASYRAGQQANAMDSIKALVNTSVVMSMGYLGANLLNANQFDHGEEKKILKMLSDEHPHGSAVRDWIQKHLIPNGDELVSDAGQALLDLKEKLHTLYPSNSKDKALQNLETRKALRETMNELKVVAGQGFEHLERGTFEDLFKGKFASEGAESTAREVVQILRNNQGSLSQFTRMINPICGVMLFGLLGGVPLANWITGKIEQQNPMLKQKPFKNALFPDSHRVWRNLPTAATGNNALHSINGHNYRLNPGPYVSCPQVADGRPLQ